MRALAALALLAVACAKPAPPTLRPERATITRVDATGVHLDVAMSATNPNSVALAADSLSARLVLKRGGGGAGSADGATITLPERVTLPAGRTTRLDVPMALPWGDVGALAALAATGRAVPYEVDGELEMSGPLSHVMLPFELEGTIAPGDLVTAAIRSFPGVPQPAR